jgi:hypothetical protein
MTGIYRVPLKKVFAKNKVDKNSTWQTVYGNKRCVRCKRHFEEGDAYRVVSNIPKMICKHVECQK